MPVLKCELRPRSRLAGYTWLLPPVPALPAAGPCWPLQSGQTAHGNCTTLEINSKQRQNHDDYKKTKCEKYVNEHSLAL